MEKFIVSARKYRPQTFDTVVGQQHITTTLKNAIKNNQLAHAFLFCGPRGVGKTTCARILGKTINCENLQPSGEACNECASCKSFNEGTSLNIHELDAASNNSVDDIRSLVEQVRFAPQAGKYKVYIVDEVHMLSASAFNAFLKTLEEPPSYAIFILATTEKHKILPTILSRCQIFDFKRITTADTVEHLQQIAGKEHIKAEKQALHVIAQKSEGCMRDSLSILDKIVSFTNGELTYQNTLEHLNILDEDYYFRLLDLLQQQDVAGAMMLYDEINSKGFDGDIVLNGFAEFMRNLLVARNSKAIRLLDVAETTVDKYVEVAAGLSLAYLISMLNVLNETEINYKMARNKRLHVELALIKLSFLQQAIELASDNNNTVVRKKRAEGPVAVKQVAIASLQSTKKGTQTSKLYIQQPPENKTEKTAEKHAVKEPLIPQKASEAMPKTQPPKEQTRTKKNLLETLREKCGDKYKVEEIKEAEPLTLSRLKEIWLQYADKLEEQQKHSSAVTFRAANIKIEEDNYFVIKVHSLIQHNFIQQEKATLNEVLQAAFCNRSITFSIIVEEGDKQELPLHQRLNSRQRLEHIAKEYPLVIELKNRLNLDLDY